MSKNDVDVATILGLRNTDMHNDAIQVTNQHVFMGVHAAVVQFSTSFSAKIKRADGSEGEETYSEAEAVPPAVNTAFTDCQIRILPQSKNLAE